MAEIVVFLRSKRFLGSQIVAFPLLYQLKQCWPGHKLRVVAQDAVGEHYRALPWVDEFVLTRGLRTNLGVLGKDAEIMVALHHTSEQYPLISTLKRPAMRLGFRHEWLGDFMWTHSCPRRFDEYIGLTYMNLLRTARDFDPSEAARRCFGEIASLAAKAPAPVDVVLVPGGGSGDYKRWGVDNFLALADGLKARMGPRTTFGFVLGPAEQEGYDALKALGRPDFHLAMCRPLPEITRLMQGARLVVANDCGPSHLAQGLGAPYVGIFHRNNPEWFWVRPNARKVVPAVAGQGIRTIRPEQVLQACVSVLGLSGAAVPAVFPQAPMPDQPAPAAGPSDRPGPARLLPGLAPSA